MLDNALCQVPLTRRQWTRFAASALGGGLFSAGLFENAANPQGTRALAALQIQAPAPAKIAITLDLEMSRNFPVWEDTHWDYEKGNLNQPTKEYTQEACRRVKAAGGVLHTFCVGRVLEQENVDWLKDIAAQGHPIGNHTYDHVNVLAAQAEDLQFRFRRAPWLIAGQMPLDVIRENIRLTTVALQQRLGVTNAGFRTPGGFPVGLSEHAEVQKLLLDLGFSWVSSQYPAHPMPAAQTQPDSATLEKIVAVHQAAQPYAYPSGLVEIPMSPVSDINAFRGGRWQLEWFLEVTERLVQTTIAQRLTWDFLAHPSCLYVVDPEFRAIDLICKQVQAAGPSNAKIVSLDEIASGVPIAR